MISLKEHFIKEPKEKIYAFYTRICLKPQEYSKITRQEIYNYLIKSYIADPEIILRLCNIEEINLLKLLLENPLTIRNNGYIEYLLMNDLLNNYLILATKDEYYIPEDLINPIKMAINLYNEEEYSLKDITDSVLLGLVRIHNVISIADLLGYLQKYNIIFDEKSLKSYLENSLRNNNLIKYIQYKKTPYLISLENMYYKDILALKKDIPPVYYTLEEIISYGKYKINLFKEPIFNFLCFLEQHLDPKFIAIIIDDLIIYTGFDLNNNEALKKIAGDIPELYESLKKIEPYFPIWLYNGHSKISIKSLK